VTEPAAPRVREVFDGATAGSRVVMSFMTEARERVTGALREQGARYGGDQPLRGYATTMATYAGMVSAIGAGVKITGRELPAGFGPADVALCAAATFKLSRLLSKDPITSPLRAPFASYEGTGAPSEVQEDVRAGGQEKKAIGELVTCPFCTSVWVATGMTAGLIFAPRATRIAMGTLAALAGADILQFTHAWLDQLTS
jgi:hypothetical protein